MLRSLSLSPETIGEVYLARGTPHLLLTTRSQKEVHREIGEIFLSVALFMGGTATSPWIKVCVPSGLGMERRERFDHCSLLQARWSAQSQIRPFNLMEALAT